MEISHERRDLSLTARRPMECQRVGRISPGVGTRRKSPILQPRATTGVTLTTNGPTRKMPRAHKREFVCSQQCLRGQPQNLGPDPYSM